MKLLVGYGNTLRQDDGVGWWIASQLAPRYCDSEVAVVCVHQLLPEIAQSVAESEQVVFVDACIEGPAGCVTVQQIEPASAIGEAHALHPPEILRLAHHLYGVCPPAWLVTIAGETFELGDTLSDPVQAAIPRAVEEISQILAG